MKTAVKLLHVLKYMSRTSLVLVRKMFASSRRISLPVGPLKLGNKENEAQRWERREFSVNMSCQEVVQVHQMNSSSDVTASQDH